MASYKDSCLLLCYFCIVYYSVSLEDGIYYFALLGALEVRLGHVHIPKTFVKAGFVLDGGCLLQRFSCHTEKFLNQ